MYIKSLILLSFLFSIASTTNSIAKEIKEDSAKVSASFLYGQYTDADFSIDKRNGYGVSYNAPLPHLLGFDFFDSDSRLKTRFNSSFFFSLDQDEDTQEVTIDKDFYDLGAGLELTYSWYLRFIAGISGYLHYESISYDVAGVKEDISDYQGGASSSLGIEYQITDEFLFTYKYEYLYKYKDEKSALINYAGISLLLQ